SGPLAVGAAERAGDGAPEQVGRCCDVAVRSERVGEVAEVLVDAVDCGGKDHGRHRSARLRHREVAVEIAACAPVDLVCLARHGSLLVEMVMARFYAAMIARRYCFFADLLRGSSFGLT